MACTLSALPFEFGSREPIGGADVAETRIQTVRPAISPTGGFTTPTNKLLTALFAFVWILAWYWLLTREKKRPVK
jgi:hypothetical protein